MERVQTLKHNGKDVILVDLSHCKPEESVGVIKTGMEVIGKAQPKSARVLTDVTESVYDKNVASAIKDFVKHNTPFVKCSAVVGATGIREVLLNTVIFITRREIKTFRDRQSAMDWVASIS